MHHRRYFQQPELFSLSPTLIAAASACRQALVHLLAQNEARSRQVKLDNERAANINFLLLLAKLGLPEGGARRVPPDFGLLSAADIVPLVQGVNSIDQLKFQ